MKINLTIFISLDYTFIHLSICYLDDGLGGTWANEVYT